LSEPYTPDNLLDRHTPPETLADAYEAQKARERALLDAHLTVTGGTALSIGGGWHPGRHLLPADRWRLVTVDVDPERPAYAVSEGRADEGLAGRAGELEQLESGAYDLVLYRLVLHHVAYAQPLGPVFAEAARLLRPGGALVAIEPSVWHPVGAALGAANRLNLGVKVHGTPDDVPLSPRRLVREARRAGLRPELHTVTYGWRRLPRPAGRLLERLDRHGSRRCARWLGHTVMLIAYRP
jgi:SAM-dependent methyltransferase